MPWYVAPRKSPTFCDEEIRDPAHFTEKFYQSEVWRSFDPQPLAFESVPAQESFEMIIKIGLSRTSCAAPREFKTSL
jgi:hypothetical protein